MEPLLIVGLGNPGSMYEQTRHNVGFRTIDVLCERLALAIRPGKGEYEYASGRLGEADAVLLKPLTYMNNSGAAVLDGIDRMGGSLEKLLVIVDDAALPLGTLRLRPAGSDGGHHGLSSVIYHLQSDQFPRLRCGIGWEEGLGTLTLAEFVLSPFEERERKTVDAMIERAADAAIEWATSGIERAMNMYNA